MKCKLRRLPPPHTCETDKKHMVGGGEMVVKGWAELRPGQDGLFSGKLGEVR